MKSKSIVKQAYIVKIGEAFFVRNSITVGDPSSWNVWADDMPNDCVISVSPDDAWEFSDESGACIAADKYGGKVMKKTLLLEDV